MKGKDSRRKLLRHKTLTVHSLLSPFSKTQKGTAFHTLWKMLTHSLETVHDG